jgi:hypothetical protein
MNDIKEKLVTGVVLLSILPIVSTWVYSYEELKRKYGLQTFFCPEFRFGMSTLLMGAIFYRGTNK